MNKKGMLMLSIAAIGFLFGSMLLMSTSSLMGGYESYVGKVQKETLNEYEILQSQKFSFKEYIKSTSYKIIKDQAEKGIEYNSKCENWETSNCLNKKEEFLKELEKKAKEDLGYEIKAELNNNKLKITTNQVLEAKKDKIKLSIPLKAELTLNYDFSDYNKIAYDVSRRSHCVLEEKINPNDCFKGLKFEYIVTKEDKLIKYEVTTGKIVSEGIWDIKVGFTVDKSKLEEATKIFPRVAF